MHPPKKKEPSSSPQRQDQHRERRDAASSLPEESPLMTAPPPGLLPKSPKAVSARLPPVTEFPLIPDLSLPPRPVSRFRPTQRQQSLGDIVPSPPSSLPARPPTPNDRIPTRRGNSQTQTFTVLKQPRATTRSASASPANSQPGHSTRSTSASTAGRDAYHGSQHPSRKRRHEEGGLQMLPNQDRRRAKRSKQGRRERRDRNLARVAQASWVDDLFINPENYYAQRENPESE